MSAPATSSLVPVAVEDYLDEDKPIRGQEYVCLSFLSPEDALKRKDVFYFQKFITNFSQEMNGLFKGLAEKYPDQVDGLNGVKDRFRGLFNPEEMQNEFNLYVSMNSGEMDKEFLEKNDFRTCVRGIKVRGSYETLREAQVRCEVLKRTDTKHNIYIAKVGCWCPWSPNPDDIPDQEFAETALNTLMKEYKNNLQQKEIFYEARKDELKRLATEHAEKNKKAFSITVEEDPKEEVAETPSAQEENPDISSSIPLSTDVDPWLARKMEESQKQEASETEASTSTGADSA